MDENTFFKGPQSGPNIYPGPTIKVLIFSNPAHGFDASVYYPAATKNTADMFTMAFNLTDEGMNIAESLSKNFSTDFMDAENAICPAYCVLYDFHTTSVTSVSTPTKINSSMAVHCISGADKNMLIRFLNAILDSIRTMEKRGNLVLISDGIFRIADKAEHIDIFVSELSPLGSA